MTREEITNKIYDAHQQLQTTIFGRFIMNREKLEKHLPTLDDEMLAAALRLFESLYEQDQEQK